jgi:cytochrome c oxidase cbb3-type subunit 3
MNSVMIKAMVFAVILIITTIMVVSNLNIDIFGDDMTAITMFGAVAIATLTSSIASKYINQMKTDTSNGKLTDEMWDGIGEYKNELPSGWAYSFLGLFIWSMWYGMIGYPVNAYSQIGEYNEEVLAYNAKFETKYQNVDTNTLKEMGESIFLVQCSQCHGSTGDGLSGKAHNFNNRINKTQVLEVINNGQSQLGYDMGAMPGGMLSGAEAEEVAAYVAGGMKDNQPLAFSACGSCHGEDGKGMGGLAPNIAEYDATLVTHVLQNGKKGLIGKMPAFKTLISPIQEKALTVYLQSLSK